jgi:N-acetylmuramoyl-L-alanine amidase
MPMFAPDSSLVAAVRPSPNHGGRRDVDRPTMLILHYTGMVSTDEALSRLSDGDAAGEYKVSTHYFVFEDGRIVQCVPEACEAWHAGQSSWEGEAHVNSRSIGVEIANPGHSFGYPDFPNDQIDAVIALCADILRRYPIRADRILAHSDVAPSRKEDPGEKFPWRRLFEAGIGHWVEPTPIAAGPALKPGDRSARASQLQGLLAEYGYGLNPTGFYSASTCDVVAAFQRHFRPARVDGIADGSTLDTLERLVTGRRSLLAVTRAETAPSGC